MTEYPAPFVHSETADVKPVDSRPRVSIDADAWKQIDHLLADLPFRVAAPVVSKINETGGVQPIK